MKNLKLSQRLLGGFGLLIAGMGILAFIALSGVTQIRGHVVTLTDDCMAGLLHIGEARSNVQANWGTLESYVQAEDAASRAQAMEEIKQVTAKVTASLKEYEATITSDEDRRLFKEISDARTGWVRARGEVISLVDAGKIAEAKIAAKTHARPAVDAYMAATQAEVDFNAKNGERVTKDVQGAIGKVTTGIWTTIALAVMIGLGWRC